MEDDFKTVFKKSDNLDVLFGVPVRRAAYSDRTAHLMACMAQAAYYKFEGGRDLVDWVEDLMDLRKGLSKEKARSLLAAFASEIQHKDSSNEDALRGGLKLGGF